MFLTHQLVRHRIASYSQQSQRYVKEHDFETIVPASIASKPEAKAKFDKLMTEIQAMYDAPFDYPSIALEAKKRYNSETYYKQLIQLYNL